MKKKENSSYYKHFPKTKEYDKLSLDKKSEVVRKKYQMKDGSKQYITSPDFNLRELEIQFIIDAIKKHNIDGQFLNILDVGCGNGYTDINIAKKVNGKILGVDFSSEMINGANILKNKNNDQIIANLSFQVGDVINNLCSYGKDFDFVISERCLLNLPNKESQYSVIKQIHKILKKNGYYIMVEGTLNGLERLNYLRQKVGLTPIADRADDNVSSLKFNEEEIETYLSKQFEIVNKKYFGMYYLISRIVHPLLVLPEQPKYYHKLNEVARKLALIEPDFNKLGHVMGWVLKKK